MNDTARLVLLDAESAGALNTFREDDLRAHLPPGLDPLPALRLSDFGAPRVVRHGEQARPVDWRGVGLGVLRLAEAAREQGRAARAPVHTLVAGQGPLPVFVLAGCELSAWAGATTLVNRRKDGTLDVLRLDATAPLAARPPFDAASALPRKTAQGEGIVALSISTRGVPASHAPVEAFARKLDLHLTALVELHSRKPLVIDPGNARAAFAQIEQTLGRVHALFPRRAALALFVDGPTTLAFLAGRAVNPGAHGTLHVPFYVSPQRGYEHAFTLPWGRARSWPRRTARVVFVSAAPDTSADRPLAIDEEQRAIQQRLRAAELRHALRFEPCPAARPDDLLQALNQHAPAVVHFAGHGRPEGIVLLDEAGAPRVASREALVSLFRAFAGDVRLVVLNTCFGEEQARAVTQEIECAVGMPAEADDEAARVFAAAFYGALGFGRSVADAFEQGCAALALHDFPAAARPRLMTKAGVDAAQVFLLERETA